MKTLVDQALRGASDTLDDLEDLRISTENRHRMLTRSEEDSDGHQRGLGLNEFHPLVAVVSHSLEALKTEEHLLELQMKRELRLSPFAQWAKTEKGVGEKQAARLLAALGDPYINETTGEPRTLRQLWAYAGYAVDNGTARKRKKGEKSNWSSEAKMRTYLVATSCVKALGGRYRAIYDLEKEYNTGAVHEAECVRCGPAGKPAQPGSLLSDGHRHARAIRAISKTILKDLYNIAKAAHESK